MNIFTQGKIPVGFQNLPLLYKFINVSGDVFLLELISKLEKLEGKPSSSNIDWQQIANEFSRYARRNIQFKFYRARNPFFRGKVISHATIEKGFNTINYNTAFWGISSYTLEDWLSNFYHELTHCVDAWSVYSFGHKNQSDFQSAPFVVANEAVKLYREKYVK